MTHSKNHVALAVVLKPAFDNASREALQTIEAKIAALTGVEHVGTASMIRGTKSTHTPKPAPLPEPGTETATTEEPVVVILRHPQPEPRDVYGYIPLRLAPEFYNRRSAEIAEVVNQLRGLEEIELVHGPAFFDMEAAPKV